MNRLVVLAAFAFVSGLSLAAGLPPRLNPELAALAQAQRPTELLSGRRFLSEQSRSLQEDPVANPGLLWVELGRELWHENENSARSCAECHGEVEESMRLVATHYPKWDPSSGGLINLEGRINACRQRYQQADTYPYENESLLSLTALIAYQSRGLPMAVSIGPDTIAWFAQGLELYTTRQGQLNLACTHCHQDNYGKRLRGERLSQGHSNGYPTYRLEWQTLGSLHRRLRACNAGVRAELYPLGASQYLALELFLAWRASGLAIEAPAVRR